MFGTAGTVVYERDAQQCDDAMLCAVPEFVSLGGLLKATPSTEGDDRILYIEASNEDADLQNEIILQQALAESAPYFLRYGNIDLSHYTILGPKSGIPNFLEYEIGKPVDVRMDGPGTFVKSLLYRGDSPMARNADMVWDSLTKQAPPTRWYPSVGGSVFPESKSIRIDPDTGAKIAVIGKVRWNNIALDRRPVNTSVPEVSTTAHAVFAKSLNGFVIKALEAGYGTDVAGLTGGAALGKQSLDRGIKQTIPASYWDFRERIGRDMTANKIKSGTSSGLVSHGVQHYGLDQSTAAEWVERYLHDSVFDHLKSTLKRNTR